MGRFEWSAGETKPELLAWLLSKLHSNPEVGHKWIIDNYPGRTKAYVKKALRILVHLRILEMKGRFGGARYKLSKTIRDGSQDFLMLNLSKEVRVSPKGNRRVTVRGSAMALRDGIESREGGSVTWTRRMHTPKPQLRRMRVIDPSTRKIIGCPKVQRLVDDKQHVKFVIRFDPPMKTGQIIEYGFYLWNTEYYGMSREEALSRYQDEWVREGLQIGDPALKMELTIKLPRGFHYQKARVERNPTLRTDAEGSPGEILSELGQEKETLHFNMTKPPIGKYFICWIPQSEEQASQT